MILRTVLLFLFFTNIFGLELPDYNQCCHYCRGDEDLWVETAPAWALLVGDDQISNFDEPPAYLIEDQVEGTSTLYGREYTLRYAGAPVSISYSSASTTVLSKQYVQLDLSFTKDVAGVSVQGGFYEEGEDDLLDRVEYSITQFAVSTAKSVASFSYVKDFDGNIAIYNGPSSYDDRVLAGFDQGVTEARYVRIHPLGGRDQKGQEVAEVLMRVSVVYCTTGICFSSRSNCVVREWQGWGECTCDWAGCTQSRTRTIARYQSCGGTPCESTHESQICVPPEPLWKSIALYVGLGVIGIIIVIVITYSIHRKMKKDQPEIVFEKDKKKKKKEKKERKMRDDLGGDGKLEEEKLEEGQDEADADFAEKELTEKKIYPAAAAVPAPEAAKPEKEKKKKKKKKGDKKKEKDKGLSEMEEAVVVTADDQPVMNADNKPVRPISKMGHNRVDTVNERAKSVSSMDQLMNDIVSEEPAKGNGFGDPPPAYDDW